MQANSILDTVIFDMDGLLIDSEPIWEKAGLELLQQYGCQLTPALYQHSVGLRTQEWLQHWYHHFGIQQYDVIADEKKIVDLVVANIAKHGKALPGVPYIFEFFQQRGYKIGLATSSPMRMAEVVVERLGIGHYLQAITSAERLPYGKPHPEVYIQCAHALQSKPIHCVCFEDSVNGMIAVKAAKMKCVVVPASTHSQWTAWGVADLKIASLTDFNHPLLQAL